MRYLFLALLISISIRLTAQPLQPIATYLNSKQVSAAAKDYYNGKFSATDDDRTFSIFDSLRTTNNATRPFYIFLTSRILQHVDGALSEMAGLTCQDFIEKHPNELATYLRSLRKLQREKETDRWAMSTYSEFAIGCEANVLPCIDKSYKIAASKVSKANKEALDNLFVLIRHYASQ